MIINAYFSYLSKYWEIWRPYRNVQNLHSSSRISAFVLWKTSNQPFFQLQLHHAPIPEMYMRIHFLQQKRSRSPGPWWSPTCHPWNHLPPQTFSHLLTLTVGVTMGFQPLGYAAPMVKRGDLAHSTPDYFNSQRHLAPKWTARLSRYDLQHVRKEFFIAIQQFLWNKWLKILWAADSDRHLGWLLLIWRGKVDKQRQPSTDFVFLHEGLVRHHDHLMLH